MYTLCQEKKYLVLPQENLREVTNQAFLVKQLQPRIGYVCPRLHRAWQLESFPA